MHQPAPLTPAATRHGRIPLHSGATGRATASRAAQSSFMPAMALGMLLVILLGFGPTFFLRALFDVPEIPFYLFVHGGVSTAWFALLVAQATLVARGRTRLHRQLGIAAAAVGAAMVASGVQTSLGMVPRRLAAGIHMDAAEIDFIGAVASANFAFFAVFPTLVGLALWLRRKPDIHRRLMMVASISILGPAALRIATWFGEIPNPVTPIIVFGFLIALIAHDIATRGRPHGATLLGALYAIVVSVAFQLAGVGDAVVAHQLANP